MKQTETDEQRLTEIELVELLPGYVMGILEPSEVRIVHRHLYRSPDIAARIASLEEIMVALAFTVPAKSPSEKLKSICLSIPIINQLSSPQLNH